MLFSGVIPNGRLKTFLYDRTLQERRPELFWIVVVAGYTLVIVIALLVSEIS